MQRQVSVLVFGRHIRAGTQQHPQHQRLALFLFGNVKRGNFNCAIRKMAISFL